MGDLVVSACIVLARSALQLEHRKYKTHDVVNVEIAHFLVHLVQLQRALDAILREITACVNNRAVQRLRR